MHLKLCDFATANMVGKYFDTKIMNFVDISQKDYQEAVQNAKSKESKNNVNRCKK